MIWQARRSIWFSEKCQHDHITLARKETETHFSECTTGKTCDSQIKPLDAIPISVSYHSYAIMLNWLSLNYNTIVNKINSNLKSIYENLSCQAGTIRISEVCNTRHHGRKIGIKIEGSPETLRTSVHYGIEGLSGIPKLGPRCGEVKTTRAARLSFLPSWKSLEKSSSSLGTFIYILSGPDKKNFK